MRSPTRPPAGQKAAGGHENDMGGYDYHKVFACRNHKEGGRYRLQ
jgi:hypothetical protein